MKKKTGDQIITMYENFIRKFTNGKEEVPKKDVKEFYKQFLGKFKKGSLGDEVFTTLEGDNKHGLNGVLYVNGYYDFVHPGSHDWMLKQYKRFKFKDQ